MNKKSAWKIPFFRKNKNYYKNTCLYYFYLNKIFKIHDGLKIVTIKIDYNLLGHKIGEYISTKKTVQHPVQKIRNIKKKSK